MRASLTDEAARRFVYFSEPLDAQRFPMTTVEPEFLALLRKKYRALRIDVVVTVSKPALDFYRRTRRRALARCASCFTAFRPVDEAGSNSARCPRRRRRRDFGGTIDIARRLQPKARRILVISGVGERDLQLEGQVRRLAPARPGPASVEFLSGCRCRNWWRGWHRSPQTRSSSISRNFVTATGETYPPPDVAAGDEQRRPPRCTECMRRTSVGAAAGSMAVT